MEEAESKVKGHGGCEKVLDTKRNCESFLPYVERALHIWFGEMRSKPHAPPLSKQVLIEKAS